MLAFVCLAFSVLAALFMAFNWYIYEMLRKSDKYILECCEGWAEFIIFMLYKRDCIKFDRQEFCVKCYYYGDINDKYTSKYIKLNTSQIIMPAITQNMVFGAIMLCVFGFLAAYSY